MTKGGSLKNIQTISGHSGAVYSLIHADGKLYTSGGDKFVVQWDIHTGEQTGFVAQMESTAYTITLANSNQHLVIGQSNGQIHVIDIAKRKVAFQLNRHRSSIYSLTYSDKNNQLYSGDKWGGFCVWDATTFEFLFAQTYDCGRVGQIVPDNSGQYLALCGQDGIMRILDAATFELIQSLKISDYSLKCALFQGEDLIVGGRTAFISKWDWRKGQRKFNFKAHNYSIYDLTFIDKGRKIVSASFDKTLKLWNSADFSLLDHKHYANDGHTASVNRITKIDERKFATCSDDRSVKLWELMEG